MIGVFYSPAGSIRLASYGNIWVVIDEGSLTALHNLRGTDCLHIIA